MEHELKRDLVVVGASAGGVEALKTLAASTPSSFAGCMCIVLHMSPTVESYLPQILSVAGSRPASHPRNGDHLEPGSIFVAPPDHHLQVVDGAVRVSVGPKENCHRPSIDVLFRSAAQSWGSRVIGVLLTGADDDGAAGLQQIRECGGTTIVQHPSDAVFPEMPLSALRLFQPDYALPVAEIGPVLAQLSTSVVERRRATVNGCHPMPGREYEEGHPSSLICPDCGGSLWELEEGAQLRYKCRVGHAYSTDAMLGATSDMTERALWAAVRSLEENADLLRRVGRKTPLVSRSTEERAQEHLANARILRQMLTTPGPDRRASSKPADEKNAVKT